MRYIGLDIGDKHIGVAVGELLASELDTLNAPKNQGFYQHPQPAYNMITKLFEAEKADALVAGLPVNEAGELTSEAKLIKHFGDDLATSQEKEIYYVNETLSSFMAAEMLESQGLNITEAKQREHQLAAQLILQQFLEENV